MRFQIVTMTEDELRAIEVTADNIYTALADGTGELNEMFGIENHCPLSIHAIPLKPIIEDQPAPGDKTPIDDIYA